MHPVSHLVDPIKVAVVKLLMATTSITRLHILNSLIIEWEQVEFGGASLRTGPIGGAIRVGD